MLTLGLDTTTQITCEVVTVIVCVKQKQVFPFQVYLEPCLSFFQGIIKFYLCTWYVITYSCIEGVRDRVCLTSGPPIVETL